MPRKSANRKKGRKMARPRARSPGDAMMARGAGSGIYQVNLFHGWAQQQVHSAFPDRIELNLDYWTTGRLNPGVVFAVDTIFNCNSVFDPEFTGVGHQPQGFDTLATIYGKYRVLRALFEIEMRQRTTHGIQTFFIPSNSSAALAAADVPGELPRAVNLGVTSSSQPVAKKKVVVLPRSVLGMTETEFRGDDATAAVVTANPAQLVYGHMYVTQLDATTVLDCEYSLRIRYVTEFYDRKVLGVSSLLRENADLRAALGGARVLEGSE